MRLPLAPDAANDPHRATTGTFPDLLIARLARHSGAGLVCALCAVASATLIATACLRRITARGVYKQNPTGG
jgi:hypothetical protein